jgi:hypothetical protein
LAVLPAGRSDHHRNIPTAGVRFINAVPDSSGAFGFTLRFVDIVENNVQFGDFRNNRKPRAGVRRRR